MSLCTMQIERSAEMKRKVSFNFTQRSLRYTFNVFTVTRYMLSVIICTLMFHVLIVSSQMNSSSHLNNSASRHLVFNDNQLITPVISGVASNVSDAGVARHLNSTVPTVALIERSNVSSNVINDVPSNVSSSVSTVASSSSTVAVDGDRDDSKRKVNCSLKSANESTVEYSEKYSSPRDGDGHRNYSHGSLDISSRHGHPFNVTDAVDRSTDSVQQSTNTLADTFVNDEISNDASNIVSSSPSLLLQSSSLLSWNITSGSTSSSSPSSIDSKVASTLNLQSACDTSLCTCSFTRSIVSTFRLLLCVSASTLCELHSFFFCNYITLV